MKYKNKYDKRICYVGTIYSLLLYLLHSSIEDINHTFFIFAYGIPDSICRRFKYYYILNHNDLRNKHRIAFKLSKYRKLGWLLGIPIKLLILKNVGFKYKLYAQDHLFFSTDVIGNHDYILIEDSAKIFTNVNNGALFQSTWRMRYGKDWWLLKKLYGETLYGPFGKNKCCKEVLLSEDDNHPSIKDKIKHICNLYDSWRSSSTEKKEFINRIFDLQDDDLSSLSRKNVLFTQCLYPDLLSEKEHAKIYKKVLSHFSPADIVIKTHPRDVFDYKSYFPEYDVFDKIIPAQLLSLNGITYNNIITVCSTSVANVKYTGKLIWFGTEIDEKIFKIIGHIEPPQAETACVINC